MKKFTIVAVLSAIVLSFSTFAGNKPGGNEPYHYSYTNSNVGNTSNPQMTSVEPVNNVSAEKQALMNQLQTARMNNDFLTAKSLQDRLSEMNPGTTSDYNPVNDPNKTGILNTEVPGNNNSRPPFQSEGDYQTSTITSGGYWAIATATSQRSTAIFAAVTEYVNGGGDMIKTYVSYNGGQTWVLKNTFNGFAATVDCRNGELDIEPYISGTDTMVYVVTGYTFNSHALVYAYRVNIGTGAGAGNAWSFGGALDQNVNTYNPHVTSDNTNYTGLTYVYFLVSSDSAGTVRQASRFAVNTGPLTGTTLTYRMPNASGVSFWWQSNGAATLQYLHQDICYFQSGGTDRLYTVYNLAGASTDQNIYISWSNDYGVTTGAGNAIILNETANVQNAICAANGTNSNTLVIGYRRFFNPDWDYRLQYNTTGGSTTGGFTASYAEFTTDTTLRISMQGVDNGTGRFVLAYATNEQEHWYRKFNAGSYTTALQTNNLPGAISYGAVQAGYWASSSADSCVVVWSTGQGANAYCSRLICTTVGIQGNNSQVPSTYSLDQNYPNPFNPTTNIKFAIPTSGLVKLVVFDITGREVATLVNQNLNAGGYTADFDASKLSSGVYFYTITAGSFTDTKKMILVK